MPQMQLCTSPSSSLPLQTPQRKQHSRQPLKTSASNRGSPTACSTQAWCTSSTLSAPTECPCQGSSSPPPSWKPRRTPRTRRTTPPPPGRCRGIRREERRSS
ncbi:hypothetical protein V8G54_015317 [Vigna mungo]|uniref:Uncharacterized protein n=1 Tax=Vigna mungo TaxID=3915 RepID=A0AAQ3RYB1_VIGMU